MDMIEMASDRCANTSTFHHMVGEHSEHLVAKGFSLEETSSFFGREDDVQPDLSVRLRHGVMPPFFVANGRAVGLG
jgi:hypothetical protein